MQIKKREAESLLFSKLGIKPISKKHHIGGYLIYKGRRILKYHFSHGRGDMVGNVGDIFRQSFLLDELQFINLLKCPLDKEGYINILKEKGRI